MNPSPPEPLVIVGPGRLGRSLAILLERSGDWTVTLVGRGRPIPDASPILLTVPDDRIAQVVPHLPAGPVVLHTSGATGLEVFQGRSPVGSFHPLMTFPGPERGLPSLQGVTAAVDGCPSALAIAERIACSLKMQPLRVTGDRRLYHAAAVMAGNFATVLLAEAARVLEKAGVPAEQCGEALAPLAVQSLRNAAHDPSGSLTGPAARGDYQTVDAHRLALAEFGLNEALDLYEAATKQALAIAKIEGNAGSDRTD